MKTYLSVGIGDMVLLDAMLTPEEKASMSEIYWACRFGKHLTPLLENNPEYPNLTLFHTISDEVGKQAMAGLDPVAIPFWHFRPDFPRNFAKGLQLFHLEEEFQQGRLQTINVIGLFYATERKCLGSSFLKNANPTPYGEHILFHYPSSTRPRSDIASITESDWRFVESLSQETGLKVVVVSDTHFRPPLSNYDLLVNQQLRFIVDLAASCSFYAGCDSFCAHLATKRLPKERLFVKTHEANVKEKLLTSYFGRCFMPHPPEDIAYFYKPYLGRA